MTIFAGDQPMLDHVSITVSDIPAAERFYDAIMKVLGVVGECPVIPV
jgi:catechol-2,3-dioxygenase